VPRICLNCDHKRILQRVDRRSSRLAGCLAWGGTNSPGDGERGERVPRTALYCESVDSKCRASRLDRTFRDRYPASCPLARNAFTHGATFCGGLICHIPGCRSARASRRQIAAEFRFGQPSMSLPQAPESLSTLLQNRYQTLFQAEPAAALSYARRFRLSSVGTRTVTMAFQQNQDRLVCAHIGTAANAEAMGNSQQARKKSTLFHTG